VGHILRSNYDQVSSERQDMQLELNN